MNLVRGCSLRMSPPKAPGRSEGGKAFIQSRVGAAWRSFPNCQGPESLGPCESADAGLSGIRWGPAWGPGWGLGFCISIQHPTRPGEGSGARRRGGPLWAGGLVRIVRGAGTGAAGSCPPRAPLSDAVGSGRRLVCAQAGSRCRGLSSVLLLFLCCSFSPASTTWTRAPGTAVALWILHLQPMPQPELLPARDEHSASADSHPAWGRRVARGRWLRAAPRPSWPLCPLVLAALTAQPCPPPTPSPVVPCSGFVPRGLGPDSPLGGMLRTRFGVCSSDAAFPVQSGSLLACSSAPASLCRLWIDLWRESSGRWTLLLLTAVGALPPALSLLPRGVGRWSPVTLSRPLSHPRGWMHADRHPGGHSGLLSLP